MSLFLFPTIESFFLKRHRFGDCRLYFFIFDKKCPVQCERVVFEIVSAQQRGVTDNFSGLDSVYIGKDHDHGYGEKKTFSKYHKLLLRMSCDPRKGDRPAFWPTEHPSTKTQISQPQNTIF